MNAKPPLSPLTRRTPNSGAAASEAEITLAVLKAIHENSDHTQRTLARELGIALGMVNAYLKRCVHKGYLKISQVPPRRYAYYLTPTGFNEKSQLAGEFLRQSFKFLREARQDCAAALAECGRRHWHRVGLVGLGELTDVALLCQRESDVEVVAIFDPAADEGLYHTIAVYRDPARGLAGVDAVIITAVSDAQALYELATRHLPPERVLPLKLLELVPVSVCGGA